MASWLLTLDYLRGHLSHCRRGVLGCDQAHKTEWARVFKALSIGMLPTCGILFALLVGFIAVEIWNSSATFP